MTKTEWLYGVKPEKYADKQRSLAEEKIKDAKLLLTKLRNIEPRTKEIIDRYIEVENAINWNRKLLEELD